MVTNKKRQAAYGARDKAARATAKALATEDDEQEQEEV